MTVPTAEQISQSTTSLRRWLDSKTLMPATDTTKDVRVLLDFLEALPSDRLNPWHTVTVHSTGWHMAHPITCDLANCAFDGLAQAEWVGPPTAKGVWQWHDFDDEPWDWTEDDADDRHKDRYDGGGD